MLDEATFMVVRSMGRAVPLSVMRALLWPWAIVRATPPALLRPRTNPPTALPPGPRPAGRWASIVPRATTKLNQAALHWSDEFLGPRWAQRIDSSAVARLKPLAAQRPVVLVTLHFGAYFLLPSLLRLHHLPTATLLSPDFWPPNALRRHRSALTVTDGLPAYLRAGDARGALRYLQPGRCLLVAPDHPLGERVSVPFRGSSLMIATPPLRLAAIAEAAVVPALVVADAAWRCRVHIGDPVPDRLIKSGDMDSAARHIAEQLLPIAAERPEHAQTPLVRAFRTAAAS